MNHFLLHPENPTCSAGRDYPDLGSNGRQSLHRQQALRIAPLITDVHHLALFVTNLDRSLPFYTDQLGFELVSRSNDWGGEFLDVVCGGIDNTRINIALLKAGGEIVELIQVLSPEGVVDDTNPYPRGMARIGFEVDDIELTVAELSAKGVEFLSEIITVEVEPPPGSDPNAETHYEGGRAIMFQDPDGIILELQQPPRPGAVT